MRKIKRLRPAAARLRSENDKMREALEAIDKCCSPYSLDPLERAINAVEYCRQVARAALEPKP